LWWWKRVFADVFGQEAVYLEARQGNDLVGVLPLVRFRSRLFGRLLVSLPYANYAGLLTSMPEASRALIAGATQMATEFGASYVELRGARRHLAELPVRTHKVGSRLRLPQQVDKLWASIDRKVRNQIRKAQKEGLEVEQGGVEKVDEFYAVFARNMRDLGTPVFPKRLFEHVLQSLRTGGIFIVRLRSLPVAGGIALGWRDVVLVPWASSLKEYRHLSPNMLLYWSMIEAATQNRYSTFDFGRSTRDSGTHHFKRQWGAEDVPLNWEYVLVGRETVPANDASNQRLQAFVAAWKRLPVPVTRWLGPKVIRHVP
jgi:FemAB-related protein (PEP-CTERM system-associated)